MDPVSKLGRALTIIRRAATAPRSTFATGTSGKGTLPQDTPAGAELREAIVRRLRTIKPDDPNRRMLALRVFLEQVLLSEFGEEVQNAQRFQDTIRDVQRVMESDREFHAQLNELVETLLAEATKPR